MNKLEREILRIGNKKNWEHDVRIELLQLFSTFKPKGRLEDRIEASKEFIDSNEKLLLGALNEHEEWCIKFLLPNVIPEIRNTITSSLLCKSDFSWRFDAILLPSIQEIMEAINSERGNIRIYLIVRIFVGKTLEHKYMTHYLENGKLAFA